MDLQLLKTYALSFLGVPYCYGGDDPVAGFDCSGLVSELARAAGWLKWNERLNAQQLHNAWHAGQFSTTFELGALAFYGTGPGAITHVGFCLDRFSMIEAGGGDHTTLNNTTAARQNAFVRIRPILYRKDFVCVAKRLELTNAGQ